MQSASKWPEEWAEPASAEDKERWTSITIGGRAPGQSRTDPNHMRPMQQPVWEGTPVVEKRPGGFEIPMVHADKPDQKITAKQYANNRGGYEQQRQRLKSDPHLFKD